MRDVKTSRSDAPELIALNALRFIAERPEELQRFLALSGTDPADVPQLVHDTEFLGGILDFLLADEALLLVFSAEADVSPHVVTTARAQIEKGSIPLDSGEM